LLREGRKQPEIQAGIVFLMMVLRIAWGKRHFWQMDQFARATGGQVAVGLSPASDGLFGLDHRAERGGVREGAGAGAALPDL